MGFDKIDDKVKAVFWMIGAGNENRTRNWSLGSSRDTFSPYPHARTISHPERHIHHSERRFSLVIAVFPTRRPIHRRLPNPQLTTEIRPRILDALSLEPCQDHKRRAWHVLGGMVEKQAMRLEFYRSERYLPSDHDHFLSEWHLRNVVGVLYHGEGRVPRQRALDF